MPTEPPRVIPTSKGDANSPMRDRGIWRRLRLVRADGQVYLERWGLSHPRIGGILLHRMDAPDPGIDLHDHPWTFVTIPLVGGYLEERLATRDAVALATIAELQDQRAAAGLGPEPPAGLPEFPRGVPELRRRFRPRVMRLDECHRIVALLRQPTWTLVINLPRRRSWGFYLPNGWMHYRTYDDEVRARRGDLVAQRDDDGKVPPRG